MCECVCVCAYCFVYYIATSFKLQSGLDILQKFIYEIKCMRASNSDNHRARQSDKETTRGERGREKEGEGEGEVVEQTAADTCCIHYRKNRTKRATERSIE